MFFNLKTGKTEDNCSDPCIHIGDEFLWLNTYSQSSVKLGSKGFKKLIEAAKIQDEDSATNFKIGRLNVQLSKDEGNLDLEFYSSVTWLMFVIEKNHLEAFYSFLEREMHS